MQAATSTEPTAKLKPWRPSAKQELVLGFGSYELLHGGGKGSGKSDAILAAPLRWAHEPRFRGLLLRREWKQAERTLYARSKQIYPLLGAVWSSGSHTWKFPSGAEIEINGADNESDVERYFGLPDLCFLGIDQLEHFTRDMYLALLSCVRSAAGLPLRVRLGANPGGIGHDWIVERWAPWVHPKPGQRWHDPEYRGPYADSGDVLWYRTTAGEQGQEVLCDRHDHEPNCEEDRRQRVLAGNPPRTDPPCSTGAPCSLHAPRSRVYVHGTVEDNDYLRGTAYEATLHGLDPVSRARYLGGNWMVREKPGLYFSRASIPIVTTAPAGRVVARVRYFDRAATDAKDATKKTAFTAGVRMALLDTGIIVVEHVVRGQWGPGEVDRVIVQTSDDDPAGTVIAIEKDPGQAGKSQAYYDSRLLAGKEFMLPPPQGDKATRMKPFSAQANGLTEGAAGNVVLLRGAWNEAYLRELEDCPGGLWDQIDSSSGGLILLLKLQERAIRDARARVGTNGHNGHNGRLDRASLGSLRSGL